MKKTLTLALAVFTSILSAQSFEGQISYNNSYKSKTASMTDQQLTDAMGAKQEFFIKDANYKSVMNGTLMQWQLYVNADNKVYSKTSQSTSALWNDAKVHGDEILKTKINKKATTILGYVCDELILTCKSGIQKFYFNSDLKVDASIFVNHKFGNWYDYLVNAKAVPLKSVVENDNFIMESTATQVKAMPLDPTLFRLPAGMASVQSPN